MKFNCLGFILCLFIITACSSNKANNESDAEIKAMSINSEITQQLENLNEETSLIKLYYGLENVKKKSDSLYCKTVLQYQNEEQKIFKRVLTKLNDLDLYLDIKNRVCSMLEEQYNSLQDGYYVAQNDTVQFSTLFELKKTANSGNLAFCNRNGSLTFSRNGGLLYFQDEKVPFFIQNVSDNGFTVISGDFKNECVFRKVKGGYYGGTFTPHKEYPPILNPVTKIQVSFSSVCVDGVSYSYKTGHNYYYQSDYIELLDKQNGVDMLYVGKEPGIGDVIVYIGYTGGSQIVITLSKNKEGTFLNIRDFLNNKVADIQN